MKKKSDAQKHPALTLFCLCLIGGILCVAAAIYSLLFRYSESAGWNLFDCAVRTRMHLYCPGCGGSRAVAALSSFDIAGALHYFPALVVAVILMIAAGIHSLSALFRKKAGQPFPVRLFYVPLVMVFLQYVIRNLLLVGFGVDLLGDIL